eukprot:scaffold49611_cov66-Phaeocystis_antarctica.AAC.7
MPCDLRGWLSGRRARLPIADAPGVGRSTAVSFERGPLRALSCVDANHRLAVQRGVVGAV